MRPSRSPVSGGLPATTVKKHGAPCYYRAKSLLISLYKRERLVGGIRYSFLGDFFPEGNEYFSTGRAQARDSFLVNAGKSFSNTLKSPICRTSTDEGKIPLLPLLAADLPFVKGRGIREFPQQQIVKGRKHENNNTGRGKKIGLFVVLKQREVSGCRNFQNVWNISARIPLNLPFPKGERRNPSTRCSHTFVPLQSISRLWNGGNKRHGVPCRYGRG